MVPNIGDDAEFDVKIESHIEVELQGFRSFSSRKRAPHSLYKQTGE